MGPTNQVADPSRGEHPPRVSVETNIEGWGIWPTGTKSEPRDEWTNTITDEDGARLEQKLEMHYSKLGKIGFADYKVMSAVYELLELRGGMPESGSVYFDIAELREIMGLSRGGRTDEKIKTSLLKLALTRFISTNAFYSAATGRYLTETIGLWDFVADEVVEARDAAKTGSEEGLTLFRGAYRLDFSKFLVRSFKENYTRGLDMEFFWQLDLPLAQRLYRHIEYKRNGAGRWVGDLFDLRDQFAMSESYKTPAKLRGVFKDAHNELVRKGYLAGVEFVRGRGRGKSGVVYTIDAKFARRQKQIGDAQGGQAAAAALPGTPEELFVVQQLVAAGEGDLSADLARSLVGEYGPERCAFYLEALPLQKSIANPVGWLRRYVAGDERNPWGFKPRALPDHPYSAHFRATGNEHEDRGASLEPRSAAIGRDAGPDLTAAAGATFRPPDPDAAALWENVLGDLEGAVEGPAWRVWFDDVTPAGLENTTLVLEVPNIFAQEYITERFREPILSALAARLGEGDLKIVLPEGRPHEGAPA